MPRVSIILPVHNGGSDLPAAAQSVFNQSFADWELIIVNDGSTDNTPDVIARLQNRDSRIIRIDHQQNLGLVKSLNDAVTVARGELLARLDSDDYWPEPGKLFKQVEFFSRQPECGLLGTWAEVADAAGKRLYGFKSPATDGKIRNQILWHNCFIHSSVMARKNVLLKAGGYRPEEKYVEDYGLWLRMGLIAGFANIPSFMVRYRVNERGVTQTKNIEQIERV